MADLQFVLGTIVGQTFYPINPQTDGEDLIFDGNMTIHGIDSEAVSSVMGNTRLKVRRVNDFISAIVMGDVCAFFDNIQTTQTTMDLGQELHELRLVRDGVEIQLYCYVTEDGEPPHGLQTAS